MLALIDPPHTICSPSELVLVDAGGEYHSYASDITRTWPLGGKFSSAQARVYDEVDIPLSFILSLSFSFFAFALPLSLPQNSRLHLAILFFLTVHKVLEIQHKVLELIKNRSSDTCLATLHGHSCDFAREALERLGVQMQLPNVRTHSYTQSTWIANEHTQPQTSHTFFNPSISHLTYKEYRRYYPHSIGHYLGMDVRILGF